MAPGAWLSVLLGFFILGLILDTPMIPLTAVSVAVVILIAMWWERQSLKKIVYKRNFFYTRAFPGEEVEMRLEIKNDKPLPLSWLRIRDLWPYQIGPKDEEVLAATHLDSAGHLTNVFSMRWYETVKRRYMLLFRKRGVYNVGPSIFESGDLFGLYQNREEVFNVKHLTVFPKLVHLDEVDFPPEDPFGDRRSRRRMFEDPNRPMGVREYRPEDEFRRVHWPATAKTGDMQVKVYQPTSTRVLMTCLNAATYEEYWAGVQHEVLEYLIGLTSSILLKGNEVGYQVGLLSNAVFSKSSRAFRILAGTSQKHLAQMLGTLASVTPIVTAPFEHFLVKELPKIPFGATLVIVTAVFTPGLEDALIRAKRRGRRIVVVSVASEKPELIPGVRMIHMPFEDRVQFEPDRSNGAEEKVGSSKMETLS